MKKYKPTTAGQRHAKISTFRGVLTANKPHKPLTKGGKRSVGRNSAGRITMRHRGGGHKRRLREVDFAFDKRDISARIETIEYDPNRSGFIALVCFKDGERRYVVVPSSVAVGDEFIVSENAPLEVGNRLLLKNIPVGSFVYAIEIKPDAGARIARSAGVHAEVIGHAGKHVHVKMPSGEVRKIPGAAWASLGSVSHEEHKLRVAGKAGRSRWEGKRPVVRGVAMGAHDHPYGGGEGRTGLGHKRRRTKWGKHAGVGQKTRKNKKYSDSLILSRRKVGKRKKK